MPRHVLSCCFVLSISTLVPGVVRAQTYELGAGSSFHTGCIGPSPCDCAAILLGPATGSFTLVPLLPPLGPIFEYQVVDLDWIVDDGIAEMPVTGDGLYTIDLASDTHQMVLDLDVGGFLQTYESIDFVPVTGSFPEELVIDVFHMIDGCLYNGFSIVSSSPLTTDFQRGDCNGDGTYDIADAVSGLSQLFVPGTPPSPCLDACDANDEGAFDISDPVYILTNLFSSGPDPAPPFGACGPDPSPDALGCPSYAGCP